MSMISYSDDYLRRLRLMAYWGGEEYDYIPPWIWLGPKKYPINTFAQEKLTDAALQYFNTITPMIYFAHNHADAHRSAQASCNDSSKEFFIYEYESMNGYGYFVTDRNVDAIETKEIAAVAPKGSRLVWQYKNGIPADVRPRFRPSEI